MLTESRKSWKSGSVASDKWTSEGGVKSSFFIERRVSCDAKPALKAENVLAFCREDTMIVSIKVAPQAAPIL